jgi:hypothetical protein
MTPSRTLGAIIISSLLGCRSPYSMNTLQGRFSSTSGDSSEHAPSVVLTLNPDGTFQLEEDGFELPSACAGKWNLTNQRAIQLQCNEDTAVLSHISAGFMSKRTRLLKIVNSNKLAMGNILIAKGQ